MAVEGAVSQYGEAEGLPDPQQSGDAFVCQKRVEVEAEARPWTRIEQMRKRAETWTALYEDEESQQHLGYDEKTDSVDVLSTDGDDMRLIQCAMRIG
jgi:hypothetical protein